MKIINYKIYFVSMLVFLCLLVTSYNAFATVTVSPATGGSAISADTTGGTYTSLTGPIIAEVVTADIGQGTIILNIPSGFIFDVGGTAPTVLITRTAGTGGNGDNINGRASGTSEPITSRTTTQITFTVTDATKNGAVNTLTWQNVRVRPTAGTPLASGNITKTGTSVIAGVTNSVTNLGTLTEVFGAKSQLVYTTQPSSTATTGVDFTTKPVVVVRDQFGNTVTSDSVTTVALSPILSTQVCGGVLGSGILSATPVSGAAVTSGIMTYTAMQYSAGESIKICATSSGITSALSNTIVVTIAPDTTVPSAVSNLALSNPSNNAMTVSWTAPGDDGTTGTATSYDLRYSTSTITSGNFSSATQVTGEPAPSTAFSAESMSVTGLSPLTTYYFALKTSDEVPNASTISNVPSLATTATPDTTVPSAISNLLASGATHNSILLSWTAPGDDGSSGTATSYDIRYSTSAITAGNFSTATPVSSPPSPQIVGTSQSVTVTGLTANTTYFFAIKSSDEVPNVSVISNLPSGVTSQTPISPTGQSGTINVVKTVINDNGGTKVVSDFLLFVNGISVISGQANLFPAPGPVFTITEAGDPNYIRTFSGDCDVNGQLNLIPRDQKLCIITNNDIGPASSNPPTPPLISVVNIPSPLALPNASGLVTYTYTLRNIGTVPVTNITMVGDTCSSIVRVSGDTNNDLRMDVNETWVYTCTIMLMETRTNTITATGWANGISVVDIASSTVVVGVAGLPDTGFVYPLIHVTKVPNPLTLPAGGGLVTYTEQVSNLGIVALSNIYLVDDKCSPTVYVSGDINGDFKLDTTETWTYTCRANITQTTTNTVMASGYANGVMEKDFAIAIIVVNAPSLPPILVQQIRSITENLSLGSTGDNVRILQEFLIFENRGPAAAALGVHGTTLNFGLLTQAALLEWQKAVGIVFPTGNFGPATRDYISTHYFITANLPDTGDPSSLGFTSLSVLGLKDGDTVSARDSSDPDIYIVNSWGYKRLFLNPVIFGFYGHLGGFSNVKTIAPATGDTLITSGLFRNCEIDDPRVYGVEITGEDTGMLHWINTTGDRAIVDDPNFFKKVFCINNNEFNWYQQGPDYTSVTQVPSYFGRY